MESTYNICYKKEVSRINFSETNFVQFIRQIENWIQLFVESASIEKRSVR